MKIVSMKVFSRILPLSLITLTAALSTPAKAEWSPFYDVYGESVYLKEAETWAQSLKARAGMRHNAVPSTELYLTSRIGADSRTLLESGTNIYNDNYVFVGPGVDLVSLFPGVRLTLSAGYSWDLVENIDRSGFDMQFGTITYHEIPVAHRLINEIYSELLYIHRHENTFFNIQNRLRYLLFETGNFRIFPLVSANLSYDAEDFAGARYFDIKPGLRVQIPFSKNVGINIEPQYVYRWPLQDPKGRIEDFRVLLWLYVGL